MQSFVVRVCFFPRAATSFSLSVRAFLFGLLDAKFSRRVCVLLIGLLQGLSLCGRVSYRAATKRFFSEPLQSLVVRVYSFSGC